MADRTDKSFDYASDVTKQLITLATGIVTLTITFSNDVFSLSAGNGRGILTWAWVTFLVSILAGVATLMALTGQLGRITEANIYAGPVRFFSMVQVFTFLIGVAFIIYFVIFALGQDIVVPKTGG